MKRFDGRKNPERRRAVERMSPTPIWVGEAAGRPGELVSQVPISLHFEEYRKTATTFAIPMAEEFEVDTLEGLHRGKPGDWLAIGQAGEMYPIDGAVFAATYERVR